MEITKKQFDKVMHGTASKSELKRLIELADSEIKEWEKFKRQCRDLLKD